MTQILLMKSSYPNYRRWNHQQPLSSSLEFERKKWITILFLIDRAGGKIYYKFNNLFKNIKIFLQDIHDFNP